MTKDADDRRRPRFRDFNAVQVHISLDDIEPRIWRRLIVPLDTTLADMHPIIQAAMGWKDAHLHEFEVGGLTYGDTWSLSAERTDDEARVYDAQEVRMRDFSREPGVTFAYVYDFGDNWRHTVTLEKLVAATPAPKKPSCIDGARCCPPEDVGGTSGYFEFLRVLLAPELDEADEQRRMKRWSGGRFNPEMFDLAKTDKAVRNALRRARSQATQPGPPWPPYLTCSLCPAPPHDWASARSSWPKSPSTSSRRMASLLVEREGHKTDNRLVDYSNADAVTRIRFTDLSKEFSLQAIAFARPVLLAPALGRQSPTQRSGSDDPWARPHIGRIMAISLLDRVGIHVFDGLPVINFAVPPGNETGADRAL